MCGCVGLRDCLFSQFSVSLFSSFLRLFVSCLFVSSIFRFVRHFVTSVTLPLVSLSLCFAVFSFSVSLFFLVSASLCVLSLRFFDFSFCSSFRCFTNLPPRFFVPLFRRFFVRRFFDFSFLALPRFFVSSVLRSLASSLPRLLVSSCLLQFSLVSSGFF